VLSTHLHHAIATYGQAIDLHCPADALRFALPSPLLTPTSVLLSDVLGDLPVFREPSSPPTTLGHGSRHYFDRPGTYTAFTTLVQYPLHCRYCSWRRVSTASPLPAAMASGYVNNNNNSSHSALSALFDHGHANTCIESPRNGAPSGTP
jgi:hypothetical protein